MTISKFQIFNHLIDTYIHIASYTEFDYNNISNKYVISGYPSPIFNFMYLNNPDKLIAETIAAKIPFFCFLQENLQKDAATIADDYQLVTVDQVLANSLLIANTKYSSNMNENIVIKQVENISDLQLFDKISSECFVHPENLAFSFLEKATFQSKKCQLHIAYYDKIAVGTAILSTVNNMAGIYWLSVLPSYRNRGIAREITCYIINHAKQQNFDQIVAQNLTASQSLFKKLNFIPHGLLPLYMHSAENN